jgi:hypothetical protein
VFILVRRVRLWLYFEWQLSKDSFTLRGIWNSFWGWVRPYFTLKMIPIILSLWLMTNGIWYMIGFVPFTWVSPPLRAFARWYIGFLYTPMAMEKVVIIMIAKPIYKFLYRTSFVEYYDVKLKYDYKEVKV